MSDFETKKINEIMPVPVNNERKILCGDGVLTVEALGAFIVSALASQVQAIAGRVGANENNISALQTTTGGHTSSIESIGNALGNLQTAINSITSGGLLFNAIQFQVYDADRQIVTGEYGYLVAKKTSTGNLTLSIMTQAEYEEAFAAEEEEQEEEQE